MFASANHDLSTYSFRSGWRHNAEYDRRSQPCRAIVAQRFTDGGLLPPRRRQGPKTGKHYAQLVLFQLRRSFA